MRAMLVAAEESAAEAMSAASADKQAALQALCAELEEARGHAHAEGAQVVRLTSELQADADVAEHGVAAAAELRAQLLEATAAISVFREQAHGLEAELATAREEAREAQLLAGSREEAVRMALTAEVDEAQARLRAEEARAARLAGDLEAEAGAAGGGEAAMLELRAELAEATTARLTFQERERRLEAEVSIARAEVAKEHEEAEDANRTRSLLEAQSERSLQSFAHLEGELRAGERRSEHLREELMCAHADRAAEDRSAVEALEAELEEGAALVEELEAQLEEERRAREARGADAEAAAEAAAAAVRLEAADHEAALERALTAARLERAQLADRLADTEYALQITSEAAAEEDGMGAEHVAVSEARRLHSECAALEARLQDALKPRRTAAFGAGAHEEVWDAVQRVRLEAAGALPAPVALEVPSSAPMRDLARARSTPSFALDSAGSDGDSAWPGGSSGQGGRCPAFEPPTRSAGSDNVQQHQPPVGGSPGSNPFEDSASDAESSSDSDDEDEATNPFGLQDEAAATGSQAGESVEEAGGIANNPFASEEETPLHAGAPRVALPAAGQDSLRAAALADNRGLCLDGQQGIVPSFGNGGTAMSVELERLRAALVTEEAACAEAREEARGAKRALAAREAGAAVDDAEGLRLALSEEAAKSRRLGEHALRAEESRRRLLHELAEDAEANSEAEADLTALAKVVGRAAKAIAIISREAPVGLKELANPLAARVLAHELAAAPVTAAVAAPPTLRVQALPAVPRPPLRLPPAPARAPSPDASALM